MEKEQFFSKLDKDLAEKYNLQPTQINTIRSAFVGEKKTRKELAERIAIKLSQPSHHPKQSSKGRRSHSKEYYQTLLNFIASCSTEAWNDITQITKFDKGIADTTADVSQ